MIIAYKSIFKLIDVICFNRLFWQTTLYMIILTNNPDINTNQNPNHNGPQLLALMYRKYNSAFTTSDNHDMNAARDADAR